MGHLKSKAGTYSTKLSLSDWLAAFSITFLITDAFMLFANFLVLWSLLLFSYLFFFFNWDSLHAMLNSRFEAWGYKKRSPIRLKHTGNLLRKNLKLKDVC